MPAPTSRSARGFAPIALAILLGCRQAEEAPAPAAPAPAPPAAQRWRLLGRVSADATPSDPSALPFEGGAALLSGCAGATPCAAERWQAEDGAQRTLLRAGEEARWAEGGAPWRAKWRRVAGVLGACLGDPLGSAPAGDAAAFRQLLTVGPPEAGGEARWEIALSGENRCRLAGTLALDASRDRADASGLRADGLPWKEGGRERARALLRGEATPGHRALHGRE